MTNEQIIEDFIIGYQYDLRDSYNSSSCINGKQREVLKENLYVFVDAICENFSKLKGKTNGKF